MGKQWKLTDFIFLGSKITEDGVYSHEIKRRWLLGRKAMTNQVSVLKSRYITFPTKVCLVKVTVFLVVMYGCESQTIKKAECQRIDAFGLWCWRRFLRVPWTAKRSTSFGRAYADDVAPILWPPAAKSQLIGKDSDAGKDWIQEEKGMKEVKMVGWHHWLNGHGFEQAPGDGEGQRSLACYKPWSRRESDTATWLNNKEMKTK